MSLDVQQGLFKHALTQLTDVDVAGQTVAITLAADRSVLRATLLRLGTPSAADSIPLS